MGLFGSMFGICGRGQLQRQQQRDERRYHVNHQQYTEAAQAAAALAAAAVKGGSKSEPSMQQSPLHRMSFTANRRGSIDLSAAVLAAERVASMTQHNQLGRSGSGSTAHRGSRHSGQHSRDGTSSTQRRSLDMSVAPRSRPSMDCNRSGRSSGAASPTGHRSCHSPGQGTPVHNRSLDLPEVPQDRRTARQAALEATWRLAAHPPGSGSSGTK